jgi:hypothetical protein
MEHQNLLTISVGDINGSESEPGGSQVGWDQRLTSRVGPPYVYMAGRRTFTIGIATLQQIPGFVN